MAGVLYVSSKAELPNHLPLTTSVGPTDDTPPDKGAGCQTFENCQTVLPVGYGIHRIPIAVDSQFNPSYAQEGVIVWNSQIVYVHYAKKPN